MGVSRSSVLAGIAATAVLGAMFVASRGAGHDSAGRAVDQTGGSSASSATDTSEPLHEKWRFADATASGGLSGATAKTDAIQEDAMTAALGLGDFNGDGRTDVIAGRIGQPNVVMFADGPAHFAIVPNAGGAVGPASGSGAFAIGDIDADGDVDIVATSTGTEPSAAYLNDGSGAFADGTATVGLPTGDTPSQPSMALRLGATLHDWDVDGDLDLVIAHWDPNVYPKNAIQAVGKQAGKGVCEATAKIRETGIGRSPDAPPNLSRMYRNDGGQFFDVTGESGIDFGSVVAFTPSFSDVDGDGRDDLLLTGDGCSSRVYKNNGDGRFEDITKELGVGIDENGMGSAIADLNHDGLDDWFVTAIAHPGDDSSCPGPGVFSGCHGNAAYLRQPDGTFVDGAAELEIRDGGWGWGVAAADLDNSGSLALLMTNGYQSGLGALAPGQETVENRYFLAFQDDPMKLWIWNGSRYRDVAKLSGLLDTSAGRSQGRGLATVDVDGDGDLDLLVNSVNQGVSLIENRLDEPNHWLEVSLNDQTAPGNRSAVGAKVTVDAGGHSRTSTIQTGGSYGTVSEAIAHFGFGPMSASKDSTPAAGVTVNVRWPDGTSQLVEVEQIDRRIEVRREG